MYTLDTKTPHTVTNAPALALAFRDDWDGWKFVARTASSSIRHARQGPRHIAGGVLMLFVNDGQGNRAPIEDEAAWWFALDRVVSKMDGARFELGDRLGSNEEE